MSPLVHTSRVKQLTTSLAQAAGADDAWFVALLEGREPVLVGHLDFTGIDEPRFHLYPADTALATQDPILREIVEAWLERYRRIVTKDAGIPDSYSWMFDAAGTPPAFLALLDDEGAITGIVHIPTLQHWPVDATGTLAGSRSDLRDQAQQFLDDFDQ